MKRLSLILAGALVAACATAHAEDAASTVEKCERSLGTIAVSENQGASQSQLTSYGLGSPVALLRIMIQQSGCFAVVERGVAMQNLQQERALAASGESLAGSNVGKGQLQAADFVMTPAIQFTANTGGLGGSLSTWGGKVLGGLGGVVGGIAGNLKFKEAQTSLLIADVRSGIQVAAAEGMAKKTDFGMRGWNWGGAGYTSMGGYTNTPEGKMIAASLLDNYNKIVHAVRDQASLIKTASVESAVNAAASTRAGVPIAGGTSMFARLANVKVYSEPKNTSKVMGTLKKSDEVITTGDEKNGFVQIDSENFSGGWVQRNLMAQGVPAPAAAQAANEPAPASAGAANPAFTMVGSYSGTFAGVEDGQFNIYIAPTGVIVGGGQSKTNGTAFQVSGTIAPGGVVMMTAAGSAGGAVFTGSIDRHSGRLSGNWRYQNSQQGGAFSGQRL